MSDKPGLSQQPVQHGIDEHEELREGGALGLDKDEQSSAGIADYSQAEDARPNVEYGEAGEHAEAGELEAVSGGPGGVSTEGGMEFRDILGEAEEHYRCSPELKVCEWEEFAKNPGYKIEQPLGEDIPLNPHNPGMAETMHEFKHGTLHSGSKHGPKVTSRAQAIAIGMHSGQHNEASALPLSMEQFMAKQKAAVMGGGSIPSVEARSQALHQAGRRGRARPDESALQHNEPEWSGYPQAAGPDAGNVSGRGEHGQKGKEGIGEHRDIKGARNPQVHNEPAHPGFKAVQSKIAAKYGGNMKKAGAILAASTRHASKAAHKANPRLNRVKG